MLCSFENCTCAPFTSPWVSYATSINTNVNEKLIGSPLFLFSSSFVLVVLKITFTSPRILHDICLQMSMQYQSKQVEERLPASSGIHRTSISSSFRLTRGTLQTLVCYNTLKLSSIIKTHELSFSLAPLHKYLSSLMNINCQG